MIRSELRDAAALVFDLDGTLADTFEDLAAAVNQVRAAYGLAAWSVAQVRAQVGHGVRALMRACVPGLDASEQAAAVSRFLAFYSAHLLDRTHAYPGVREALAALSESLPMAVLSNKPETQTRAIVQGLGLAGFFRGVYGGDSFDAMKPDPLALARVLERLGIPNGRAVLIGDSEVDVLTARAARARVVLVTTGLLDARSAARLSPDLVIANLLELLA